PPGSLKRLALPPLGCPEGGPARAATICQWSSKHARGRHLYRRLVALLRAGLEPAEEQRRQLASDGRGRQARLARGNGPQGWAHFCSADLDRRQSRRWL